MVRAVLERRTGDTWSMSSLRFTISGLTSSRWIDYWEESRDIDSRSHCYKSPVIYFLRIEKNHRFRSDNGKFVLSTDRCINQWTVSPITFLSSSWITSWIMASTAQVMSVFPDESIFLDLFFCFGSRSRQFCLRKVILSARWASISLMFDLF